MLKQSASQDTSAGAHTTAVVQPCLPRGNHADFTLQCAWADTEIPSSSVSQATAVCCGQGKHNQWTSAHGGVGLLVSLS